LIKTEHVNVCLYSDRFNVITVLVLSHYHILLCTWDLLIGDNVQKVPQ